MGMRVTWIPGTGLLFAVARALVCSDCAIEAQEGPYEQKLTFSRAIAGLESSDTILPRHAVKGIRHRTPDFSPASNRNPYRQQAPDESRILRHYPCSIQPAAPHRQAGS
jgi:hypothetical protein